MKTGGGNGIGKHVTRPGLSPAGQRAQRVEDSWSPPARRRSEPCSAKLRQWSNPVPAHDKVEALAREVETIQGNLGHLVSELDERRRAFFDVRSQARRHPLILGGVAAGLVAAVAGTIVLVVRHRRREHSAARRWVRWRQAAARAGAHPERVAERTPGVGRKIAGAGGAAVASVLGKRLAKRFVG